MAGLTLTGFVTKLQTEIFEDLQNDIRVELGDGVVTTPDSPLGQILGTVSDRLAELWSLGAGIYAAMDPDTAEGILLDDLCARVGVYRLPASKSVGTITVTGTAGVTVTTGSIVRIPNSYRFVVTEDTVISGSTSVPVEAEEAGELEYDGDDGDITLTIVTPISGWSTAIIGSGDTIGDGRAVETDEELRARGSTRLAGISAGTVDSLAAALQELPGATGVFVDENPTATTNGYGTAPYGIQAFVYPDTVDEDLIAETIWAYKPAACPTSGTDWANVTDSMGYTQKIYFTPVVEVTCNITVTGIDPKIGDLPARVSYSFEQHFAIIEEHVREYMARLDPGESPNLDTLKGLAATVEYEPGVWIGTYNIAGIGATRSAVASGPGEQIVVGTIIIAGT